MPFSHGADTSCRYFIYHNEYELEVQKSLSEIVCMFIGGKTFINILQNYA